MSGAEVSNLLPNETETVLSLNMPGVLSSSFKKAALSTPGAFQAASFQRTFGFPLEDVQRIIQALQTGPKETVLTVMRTTKPIPRDQLNVSLKLDAQPPINGLNLHLVRKNLDSLSSFLIKGDDVQEAFYVHIYDDSTLVFANKPVMEKFLGEKATPKPLTQPPAASERCRAPARPAPGQPAAAPAIAAYLTVQPALKKVLDKIEDPGKPSLVAVGTLGTSKFSKGVAIPSAAACPRLSQIKRSKRRLIPYSKTFKAWLVGGFNTLYESKLGGDLSVIGRDEQTTTQLEELFKLGGTILQGFIKTSLDLDIGTVDAASGGADKKGGDGTLAVTKADLAVVMKIDLTLKPPSYAILMGRLGEHFVQAKNSPTPAIPAACPRIGRGFASLCQGERRLPARHGRPQAGRRAPR